MQNPLDAALANPWGALRRVLGDPLHPGGTDATRRLLDRADVGANTRLLDAGCGAGGALDLARDRGARAVGLDRDPGGDGAVRGDVTTLPVREDGVDVVLSECVLCLSDDLDAALAESRRVLGPDGRLALSDVVVDGDVPDLPEPVAQALCLTGERERAALLDRIEGAGFAVGEVRDHREDLLAMRDQVADAVDYEGLLGLFGARGDRLLAGIEDLEAAVEDGRVSYVSLVATAE
ncbi:class I SAM-dependent methyltransferase [Halorientalis pallida]|uniref:SAM-dependent methyltransferase n=1 Tax=Halorientalis pallida TaxID=2479928 RepID=A0A498L5X5_9EURY|nr:class I SAM-dependent methyltransferase [Halorientalis pallida]RXK51682.1 SAM-dependent methyltransferase [Halorientalis pallida]